MVDLIGPIMSPKSRYGYILSFADLCTCWAECVAFRTISAESVAEELMSIFSHVGFPEMILFDFILTKFTEFSYTIAFDILFMLIKN